MITIYCLYTKKDIRAQVRLHKGHYQCDNLAALGRGAILKLARR
jgi:hypothetical protein